MQKQGLRIHWQKISTTSLKNSSDGVCTFIQLCVCVWGGSSGTHCLKWVDSAGQLMIRTTRAQLRRWGRPPAVQKGLKSVHGLCFSLCYHEYKHQSEGNKSSNSGNTTDAAWHSDWKVRESSNVILQLSSIIADSEVSLFQLALTRSNLYNMVIVGPK